MGGLVGLERQRGGDSQAELGWDLGLVTDTGRSRSYSFSKVYDLVRGE